MKPEANVATDTVAFLTSPAWPTAVYWILLLASIVIAARAWRSDPAQRNVRGIGIAGAPQATASTHGHF